MFALDSVALDSDRFFTTSRSAPRHAIPVGWIAKAIAASTLLVALLMHGAGLSIRFFAPSTIAFSSVFAALATTHLALRHASSSFGRIVRDGTEYFGLFMAISLIGAVASYPVAAYSKGFADPLLYRSDAFLHFNWIAWYQAVATRPALQLISRAAYSMIYISPALLLGYFAITDQRREAYDFMAAVWIAAAITLVAFWFMPAVGPFAYLWHAPIPYLPVSDLWQPQLIPQLRAHHVRIIDLGHLVGLVSAPSFHAAAAVLLITFAARQPGIRGLLIFLNAAMLLSTPVEGTHYLTDMLLGALVAGASLGAVRLIPTRSFAIGGLPPAHALAPQRYG